MPNAYFAELRHIVSLTEAPVGVRYSRMLSLLRLVCVDASASLHADFSSLFSRLYAVCEACGVAHRGVDRMRRRARRVLFEGYRPALHEERADVAALAAFVAGVTGEAVPADPAFAPAAEAPADDETPAAAERRNLRGVVTGVGRTDFTLWAEGREYRVCPADGRVLRLLEKSVVAALVDAEAADAPPEGAPAEPDAPVVLNARTVVLEPDFLIDVTALCACLKPYGHSPLNYLLSKFSPSEPSVHILKGNAANDMMEHCLREPAAADDAAVYRHAIRDNYGRYLLDYAALPPALLGEAFHAEMRRQFDNIAKAVRLRFPAKDVDIAREHVLLEPTFLCPALGLQARFDVMTDDFERIVELKSGRADERRHDGKVSVEGRVEHVMQMNLYREILRVNFQKGWDEVRAFLFYSRYPAFFNERPSATALREVMHLRNRIVALERYLMKGGFLHLLPTFTPEKLNERALDDAFFHRYLYPRIAAVTQPLAEADELTRAYVAAFVTFMGRERFMARTGDLRPDATRGFSATWTADLTTKQLAGNILVDLRLLKINELDAADFAESNAADACVERLTFGLPDYGDNFIPNFNEGESVLLYVRNDAADDVTNRRLVRAYVERLTREEMVLRPAFVQRNGEQFAAGNRYAVEHDYSDAPFSQAYRGLFALVTAEPRRRALLLGTESPRVDGSRELVGTYDERTADVVRAAKRADDYFLLVGPPGTGKTNVALKAMVEEHLLTRAAEAAEAADEEAAARQALQNGLLLMAYTNRAVDEICGMLAVLNEERTGRGEPAFDFVRIGQPQTCGAAFRRHLVSERAAEYPRLDDARRFLKRVPIVTGTVMSVSSAAASLFALRRFSTAIIDEASQLIEPFALTLLCAKDGDGRSAVGKFVLIGDHKQLPAVVMLPPEQTKVEDAALRGIGLTDLRNSLFERLHTLQARRGTAGIVAQLNRHGRMHPAICAFVNRHFYGGMLEAVPLPHQTETLAWRGATGRYEEFVARCRVGTVDVKQEANAENVRVNLPEARVVCRLVKAILSLAEKNGRVVDAARDVGVIVPFRNQIGLVRRVLTEAGVAGAREMTVDTVECFQGSQRDYIIFSATVSRPYQLRTLSQVQRVGDTEVDRKLNVALSRARRQLFVTGDAALLKRLPVYRAFIEECDEVMAAEP